MANKEYTTPQHIKDRIVDDMIDELLRDIDYYAHQNEQRKDKRYDLTSSVRSIYLTPMEETKFINGVKKLQSASKPLKSAERKAMVSEIELAQNINGRKQRSGLFEANLKYIAVEVPEHWIEEEDSPELYIEVKKVKRIMNQQLKEGTLNTYWRGDRLYTFIILA